MLVLSKYIFAEYKIEVDILSDEEYINYMNSLDDIEDSIDNILEVFKNINKSVKGDTRKKQRIIALFIEIDSIKAREIAEKYINDEQILECIELHKEVFNSWYIGNKTKDWKNAEIKAISIIDRLDNNMTFFNKFYNNYKQINNRKHESIKWFEQIYDNFI